MKFSFFFDGILPSAVEIFTGQKYSTEDNAIAEAILKQVKKEEYHNNIYTTDRGLQSTRTIKEFEEKNIQFIVRSRENRKFEEIESFLKTESLVKWDDWEVIKDSKVNFTQENLYKTNVETSIIGKKKWKHIFGCWSLKIEKRQRILVYNQ